MLPEITELIKELEDYVLRGDRVFVLKDQKKEQASGLVLSNTENSRPIKGTIVKIGEDCQSLEVGLVIHFNEYAAMDIEVHGKVFHCLRAKDVAGYFKKKQNEVSV